jgi:hypothetical protein
VHGFSRWELHGTVDDGSHRDDLELDIGYRGVHRRGGQAWAWFTGSATTSSPARRFRRQRPKYDFVFDMIFDAPASLTKAFAEPSGLLQHPAA